MSHKKVITIITTTTADAVIIYRVLTMVRHGIKYVTDSLENVRGNGPPGKCTDSRDTLPNSNPTPTELTFGSYLSIYFSFPVTEMGIITGLMPQGC